MVAHVFISSSVEMADKTPQFIIKMGDIYYLTRAVWAYDPSMAQNPQQEDGCSQIATEYTQLGDEANVDCRQRSEGAAGGDPNQTPQSA
jgi:hypothetical protein